MHVKLNIVALFDWRLIYSLLKKKFFFVVLEKMASLGLHLLTVVLAVIFIFLGHIKLTPQFFPEYHSHVRNEFGKINKEFPFYQLTGWRPFAKHYRIGLGVTETICGMLLFFGGGL
jgi:hypothetical protein